MKNKIFYRLNVLRITLPPLRNRLEDIPELVRLWSILRFCPPPFPIFIFDTTAFAYLVHPEFATDVRDLWVDMNTNFDQNYGKSIVYASDPYPSIGLLQDSKVIFHLNNAQFYAFYVDLLTRPVPVKFHGPSHEFDD